MRSAQLVTVLSPDRGGGIQSLLTRRTTWWLLSVWAVAFGISTWMLEAFLLRTVPGAPAEPLGGVFRLVETILWLGAIVIATSVAERWPIEDAAAQWRRVVGQIALGVALGPVWGTLAFLISTRLMPSWHSRGMWGIIATEAKGALFGYVATAILAHVVIRTLRQRAREVAAADAVREATEARLNLLKLELQPDSVLRAMDAVEELIGGDLEVANNSLVLLSDALHEVAASTRTKDVSLREELAVTEMFVRLHELTHQSCVDFSAQASPDALDAAVPHLILHPLIETLLVDDGAGRLEPQSLNVLGERLSERLHLRISAKSAPVESSDQLYAARSVMHTRERLGQIFEGDERFTMLITSDSGELRIDLSIPFRSMSDRWTVSKRPDRTGAIHRL